MYCRYTIVGVHAERHQASCHRMNVDKFRELVHAIESGITTKEEAIMSFQPIRKGRPVKS